MKFLFKKFFLFTLLFFFISTPGVVFADEIRLDTNKTEVRVGEEFTLSVIVHTNKIINAIEGYVAFSASLLEVKEVRDGNSVVNFWVEKPNGDTPGRVIFSGITPGGWSGPNQLLFSVVFVAKEIGSAGVEIKEVRALKNDGVGSKIILTTHSVEVPINSGDSAVRREKSTDTESPEDFTPFITRDPAIFDGKYFLVFGTQDKGSGIDRFEIREGSWGWFRVVESPYLLKNQKQDKVITVRAIDNNGNVREAKIVPKSFPHWYEQRTNLAILIVVIITCFFIGKKLVGKVKKNGK